MKLMKMFGLASLVVVAAMAFLGASGASAAVLKSVLCKVDQELCAAANLWGDEVTILAHSENAVLTGSLPVECLSHVTILVLKGEEHKIPAHLTELTWTNCKGCKEVTTTTLPSGKLVTTADPLVGTLETTTDTVVLLKGCTIFNIECTAKGVAPVSLAATGGAIGSTALASATNVPVVLSGAAACGTKGTWNANSTNGKPYIITSVNGNTTGNIFWSLKSHAL